MKLLKGFIVITVSFLIYACTNNSLNLMDKLLEYQEKIDSIIDEEREGLSEEELTEYSLEKKYSVEQPYESERMKTREEFLAVYQTQRDNSNDVRVDETLLQYKDLLDQVIAILEQEEIIEAVAYVTIAFGDQTEVEATVSMSPDKGVLLKMTVSFNEEMIFYGIKLGYEDENFFVRELSEYMDLPRGSGTGGCRRGGCWTRSAPPRCSYGRYRAAARSCPRRRAG